MMEVSTEQLVPYVDLASILNLAEDTPDRLHLYSKNITESIAQFKLDLYNTINDNSEEFFGVVNFPSSADKSITKLDANLHDVSERINDQKDGLDATIVEVLQKKSALQEGINKKNKLIALVNKLKSIKQDLDDFDKYIANKNIDKAAHMYRQIEFSLAEIIKEFNLEPDSMPIVLEKFHVQCKRKFSLLKEKADEYFSQMLVKKENVLSISLVYEDLTFEQVVATLKDLGIWQDKSTQLFKHIHAILREITLQPNASVKSAVIENRRVVLEVEQEHGKGTQSNKTKRGSTSYKDRKLTKVSDHIQQTEKLFSALLVVLRFLKDEVYPRFGDTSDQQLLGFGHCVLPDLFDQILKNFMTKMIPEHSTELVEYLAVIDKTVKFEEDLDTLGLSSANDPRVLSQFAKQVDRHFAKKKRRGILAEARELIVRADHTTTTVQFSTEKGPIEGEYVANSSAGTAMDESAFSLPKVQVSTTAIKLIDLADVVLQEACESTPACADNLYGATRDMFDMFRSLSSGCQGANLVNIPQMGLLFHNDCMYLAHHLLILAHRYKPKLPDPLNKKASFVDLAQDLRKLGLDYYYIQMNKQRELILDHISSMQGLSDTHKEARATQVELGLKKIVHQLNLLHKVWKDILPSEMYNKSVGALIDLAIEKMICFVEELLDISEKETHELHRLFKLLFPLENLLLPSVPSATPNTYVSKWNKYILITNILEMSLLSIIEKWNSGEMRDFKKYEIVQLIKALFSDSDLRRDQIARLK